MELKDCKTEIPLMVRILEGFAREIAEEELEKLNQKCRFLKLCVGQVCLDFVTLCKTVRTFKEECGEEAYRVVLQELGLTEKDVEMTLNVAAVWARMPAEVRRKALRRAAELTLKNLKIIQEL